MMDCEHDYYPIAIEKISRITGWFKITKWTWIVWVCKKCGNVTRTNLKEAKA